MKPRDRLLISLIGLVAFVFVGYVAVVKPEHRLAGQMQSQIASARSALSSAEAEVQASLRLQAQYETYVKQLKIVGTAVPNDEQIPQLINELQAASTTNEIDFQAVAVASSASATPGTASTAVSETSTSFPSQSLNLTFTGDYFAVARLLGTLASFVRADDKHFRASGRLISISTLTLSPGNSGVTTGQTSTGVVTAAVTALDYDVPTSLLPATSSAANSSLSTNTASPAAYVSP